MRQSIPGVHASKNLAAAASHFGSKVRSGLRLTPAILFGRDRDKVVEAFHGPRWFTNEAYAGPRAFDHPKILDAFAWHYVCDSPWFGNSRVFVRKEKLTLNGSG